MNKLYNISLIIILWLIFTTVVLYGDPGNKSEAMEEIYENPLDKKDIECEIRNSKQKKLDDMTYIESLSHYAGLYVPEELNQIDKSLEGAVSTIDMCNDINYHLFNSSSFIPKVSDEYVPISYEEITLIYNSINKLGMSPEIATFIANQCIGSNVRSHCYKFAVSIANAESGLFKRCSKNNCYGVMYYTNEWGYMVVPYASKKDGISDRIRRYKNNRQNRSTPQVRLDKNYCSGPCVHREKNVNATINILNQPI